MIVQCAKCGYRFDHELLAKHGCPNCLGEGLGPLFDSARARSSDPDTSHDAADGVNATGYGATLCRMVVERLRAVPDGETTQEIADAIGVPRDSISPRMVTVVEAGLVERTKIRRERKAVYRAIG